MDKEKNIYELMQGKNKYFFKLSIKENWIHLSITTPTGKVHSRYLSLADLQSLDKIFSSAQSEIEGIKCFDKILKEQKVAVFGENENLKIIFYIKNDDAYNQIEIFFGEEMPKSIVDIPIQVKNEDIENINNINNNVTNNIFENQETNNNQKDILDVAQLTSGIDNLNNDVISTETYGNNEYLGKDIFTNNNINNVNITNVTTSTSDTTNYIKTLPTKYLPTKIIQSTEEVLPVNDNIETNIPTQEYPTTNYSSESINYSLESSYNLYNPNPNYNEISILIDELTKMKNEEIESLKKRIDEMKNYEKQKQEENEKLILKKKIEEIEKLKKEYQMQINELRQSQKIEKPKPGMESQNITFEEKTEKVCVKGNIIHSPLELELITRKINKNNSSQNKKLILNLLYKATVDSDKASAFHKKCDKAKSTLVLIETVKGKRFGGYTSQNWKGNCVEKKDEKSFIFSFDKMKIYENIPEETAIGCYPKFGPIFMGCQIRINDNAFSRGGTTFEKGMNFNTEEDYELNGGERTFKVKEIEVYEIIIH